jgi:hypothetical protein
MMPFMTASKRIKYLKINLTKVIKDLYNSNYKTSIKETEENKQMRRGIPCSWIGKNINEKPIQLKGIYTFNTKTPKMSLIETEKNY